MNLKREGGWLALMVGLFVLFYFLPVEWARFGNAVTESLALTKWYAREHVLLCLVPAFFIAGAIAVFVSQASVMKYLGAGANKVLAYGVAATSGSVLAVCSCTILPLFAGIYRMGAGLGPASAFLYAGPAINVLAIILTARILGLELGVARAVGAIVFSVVIGLLMHVIYRNEEIAKVKAHAAMPAAPAERPLWQNVVYFGLLVGILVFANWGRPEEGSGLWWAIWSHKWLITAAAGVGLGVVLVRWFAVAWWKVALAVAVVAALAVAFPGSPTVAFVAAAVGLSAVALSGPQPMREWAGSTWEYAKLILPLLFIFNHQLLLIGIGSWFQLVLIVGAALIGMLIFVSVTQQIFVTRSRVWESAILLLAAAMLFQPGWFMDKLVPEYMAVAGSEVIERAEQVSENGFLRIEVSGADIITGVEETRVMRLPMGESGPGAERLAAVGMQIVPLGDEVQVLGAGFGSQAERLGIKAGQTISRVFVQDPASPANELTYLPALLLIGFVGALQWRRREWDQPGMTKDRHQPA